MLDWLVIGGGPHGVHVAARLLGEADVPRDKVRILDDEDVLLARWRRSTRNTGMRFLRSPAVHHLDLSSASLRRFAEAGKAQHKCQPFTRPYSRPSLDLFDRHSDDVIAKARLGELHIKGRANALEIADDHVRVGLEDGASALEARYVVLSLGAPREPEWPAWARRAAESATDQGHPSAIEHIFAPGFDLDDNPGHDVIAVVGAGISGAQVALRCAEEGRHVLLVSRTPLRVHQFDSDPGWQGPKNMASFSRIQDPNVRRQKISEARHRGSVPPDVQAALRCAISEGSIQHLEGVEVEAAEFEAGRFRLSVGERELAADRVLLATGFAGRRPGEGWLDDAIETHGLPCADCGFPIVDRGLRWHPRVLVTGALAELEIGPVSRNISGAMRAGERIAAVARADLHY